MAKKNQDDKGEQRRKSQRGAGATESILHAALELGGEIGFDALTVEGLSLHSGVAKTTIYRRWPNVSAIMMDAILLEISKEAPLQERATVRESFAVSMKLLVRVYRGRHGRTLATLIGRAQVDQGLRQSLVTRWVEPRRRIAREILRRGIDRGEIRRAVDPDIILDALYGAIYHRLLVPYEDATMSDTFVDAVVDAVFGGITARVDEVEP